MGELLSYSPLPERFSEIRAILAQYREPNFRKSVWQLLSSVIPFFSLWMLTWVGLQYGYPYILVLTVPTAGFLMRIFAIQHDCGHRSFFKSKSANDVVGCMLGLLTLTPYCHWRRTHALHHVTSGDLDRRGYGDIPLLTVKEYLGLTPLQQLPYRIIRNPFFLLGVAPLLYFVVIQRFSYCPSRSWWKEWVSVYLTNLLIATVFVFIWWFIGLRDFFLIHLPIFALATSVGVWLFYTQHNFDGTYWQRHDRWSYYMAGMLGSSHYQLPKILQWFTANIGLHHIHHLDSRIPNYRLQECYDGNPIFQQTKCLTLLASLSCMSCQLWDEHRGKMISFRELKSQQGNL
jgi:omega-6 fatty acid desaturase (delta-12 desaturase)